MMLTRLRTRAASNPLAVAMAILVLLAAAEEVRPQLPGTGTAPVDTTKPVKVYVLAGQSNVLNMGTVSVGESGARVYYESSVPDAKQGGILSIYEGKYAPDRDYDAMTPVLTEKFAILMPGTDAKQGNIAGDVTKIIRGFIEVPDAGIYRFRPGSGARSLMFVGGTEVYRCEPPQAPMERELKLEAGKRYPFRVISLDGNTSPHYRFTRLDTPGTLDMLVKQQGKFPYYLGENGEWVVREDVYFQEARLDGLWDWDKKDPNKIVMNEERLKAVGRPLTVEQSGIWIGVPFGVLLGNYHNEQVLLIRTAMGNRSLDWDFRPPSSGKLPDVEEGLKKWEGVEYYMMVEGVRKTLNRIAELVPNYKGQGYELAGFVWFQGHKDTFGTQDTYERNLVNLINDIRRDFNAPKLPVVVATVAFGGREMQGNTLKVWEAQMAVSGDNGKYPEFKDNVLSVDTRDAWRDVEESPKNQGYHYNRNAETYTLVGESIAKAMIDLKERQK